jgi:hypothetical protein
MAYSLKKFQNYIIIIIIIKRHIIIITIDNSVLQRTLII